MERPKDETAHSLQDPPASPHTTNPMDPHGILDGEDGDSEAEVEPQAGMYNLNSSQDEVDVEKSDESVGNSNKQVMNSYENIQKNQDSSNVSDCTLNLNSMNISEGGKEFSNSADSGEQPMEHSSDQIASVKKNTVQGYSGILPMDPDKDSSIPVQQAKTAELPKKTGSKAETLIPSDIYKKIVTKKIELQIPPPMGDVNDIDKKYSECGSFYNEGDGRVGRTNLSEDVSSLSISSTSFDPKNLKCCACPKNHNIFERGGGG